MLPAPALSSPAGLSCLGRAALGGLSPPGGICVLSHCPPLMVASVFIKLARHKCPASGTHLACCNQSLALQEEVTMMLHSPAQSASASAQEVPSPTLHQPTDLTVPSPHPAHTEAPASPAILKAGLNSCKVLAEFPAHSHHKHCPSSKSRWLPSVYHIRRNDPPRCGTRSNL